MKKSRAMPGFFYANRRSQQIALLAPGLDTAPHREAVGCSTLDDV